MRAALSIVLGLLSVHATAAADPPVHDVSGLVDAPRWSLFAVEYARSRGLPERTLVAGAPAGARVDMSWYFFVAVGRGRVVLVDAGTDALAGRPELRRRWAVTRAISVRAALSRVGLTAERVTDVIVTHRHWDHVDGIAALPSATVHAHAAEWRRVAPRVRRAVDPSRLRTFEADAEPIEGLSLRTAGQHTAHHVMVEIACADGPRVLAGDAAYLYRNLEEERAVAQSVDARQGVADVAAAARAVGPSRVLPGHDPALFERHPSTVEGVAWICR